MVKNGQRTIELLAPAKNYDCGKAGIDAGADAIYIGGPLFGARAAARNSVEDIERLASYGRRFGVKVYVTLNTTLFDDELEDARKMAWQLWEAGVSGLIVQDFGLLKMDLPPLELHSSTQMNTRTLEKAQWMSDAGFEQVVLARELGLEDIRRIANAINAKVEVFAHGSLCVCYSGQCYLSEQLTGRSANRGACSQPCRLPWTLESVRNGKVATVQTNVGPYLLSLKDMDRSRYVGDLIQAGVSSLKIEGRLKEEGYVKNVTAYYRKKIDDFLESEGNTEGVKRSSYGTVTYDFKPDPEKTFHRSGTDYFMGSCIGVKNPSLKRDIASASTPKSTGKKFGVVQLVRHGKVVVRTTNPAEKVENGDGFCFLDDDGEWKGFRANRAEMKGNEVWLECDKAEVRAGMTLNRNLDRAFEKQVEAEGSARRTMKVNVEVSEDENGYRLTGICLDNEVEESEVLVVEKQEARNKEKSMQAIEEVIKKSGDTPFEISEVVMKMETVPFIPKSILTEGRRRLLDKMLNASECTHKEAKEGRRNREIPTYNFAWGDYRDNVTNQKAAEVLHDAGVKSVYVRKRDEILSPNAELMRCKHCVKYLIGKCGADVGELRLTHGKESLRLEFDCEQCEMIVKRNA